MGKLPPTKSVRSAEPGPLPPPTDHWTVLAEASSPLRTTSIYSRTDGVVAWQTCRHEKRSRLVHDIEVTGRHIGMGWNREVLAAVSDRLGQQNGPWRRYVSEP